MSSSSLLRAGPDADSSRAQDSWICALRATADIDRDRRATLPIRLLRAAEIHGESPALLSQNETLTHQDLVRRMVHYAHWAVGQDLQVGDSVGVLMPTSVDYLPLWLGLTQVGAVAALVNPQLRGAALAHAIRAAAPKSVIVHQTLSEAFQSARPLLGFDVSVWTHGEGGDPQRRVDVDSGASSHDRLPERGVTIGDRALYIYTSGTTGLPKAAIVSHRRALTWSLWFSGLLGTGSHDRMYNCLPLHHSVGGVVATGSALVAGGSVFLREKFSARDFWSDIVSRDCTLFQYIGELCRYLLNAPVSPDERRHALRLCCGNGLRPDIWEAFQTRFAIPRVLEFYASTEGNLSLYNVEGRVGAVGRLPKFSPRRNAAALIRIDPDGAPLRDAQGFCIRCEPDETGEALSAISRGLGQTGSFEGYTAAADTEAKILRDVFERGDAWFRTGDLMRRDRDGFFYFVDRLGDTFRWKGENVSTLEVAEAICSCEGVREAIVYGVAVPGAEGRAGMALVVGEADLDLERLRRHIDARLPLYARPVFLRLQARADVTETYKYRKAPLQKDGFDPGRVNDPLYVWDLAHGGYRHIDAALYALIGSGAMRL